MKSLRPRAVLRLGLLLVQTGLLLPPYLLLYPLAAPRAAIARIWFRGAQRLCCLRVTVEGRPAVERPALLAANHVSYLDIMVIGALADVTFVSKAEVAGWPLFGLLARLTRTVFIERRRSRAGDHRRALAARLAAGERLVVFPEGTSSDGTRVLPFRSSLFSVAETRDVVVQPVSLAYHLDADSRPRFAWYGEMAFFPHLLDVLGLDGAALTVVFHPPLAGTRFPDRKALARHCRDRVAEGLIRGCAAASAASAA